MEYARGLDHQRENPQRPRSLRRLALVATLLTCAVLPASAQPTHTLVASGDPVDHSLADGRVFWVESPDEFCGIPGALRSVDAGGGPVTTLFQQGSCLFDPRKVMADDTWVRLVHSDLLQQIWRGGGDLQHAAGGIGPIGTLAQDATHVYWADSAGIHRMTKPLGIPEIVVAGANVESGNLYVSPDDPTCCVVWGEGNEVHGSFKGTGLVEVTLMTLPDAVTFVATNATGTTLYAADERGRVFSDVAGTLFDPGPIATKVGGLGVDATHVYWSTGQGLGFDEVQRVPIGGGAVTVMATGLQLPQKAELDDTHLYFSMSGGIYRVRKDAVAVLTDLSWHGIEVTQGIQDLANSVPLVQDKETFVRVFPRADTVDPGWVTAELHGSRGGLPLPGSPLRPERERLLVTAGSPPDREQSFDFWLPSSWTSGDVDLRAVINPYGTVPESDALNNDILYTASFTPLPPLCLQMVKVKANATVYRMTDPGFPAILDRLKTLMPHPDLWTFSVGNTLEEFSFRGGRGSYEWPGDNKKILRKIARRVMFKRKPGRCKDAQSAVHMVGMIDPSLSGGPGGRAKLVRNASWVKMSQAGTTGWSMPNGGSTAAQEIAHNYNGGKVLHSRWRHVDCGNPPGLWGGYPYCSDLDADGTSECCQIAPDRSFSTFWGFDPIGRTHIAPFPSSLPAGTLTGTGWAKDFMSYGSPLWVSDVNWRRAQSEFHGLLFPPFPSPPASSSSGAFESAATAAHPACGTGAADCCTEDPGVPACTDTACCSLVCACDPFCCDGEWDAFCAGAGVDGNGCGAAVLCTQCFDGLAGYLLVGGEVVDATGTFRLDPAYRMTDELLDPDVLQTFLEQADEAALLPGSYRAELLDSAGGILSSRAFVSEDSSEEVPGDSSSFDVLIPWDPAAVQLRIRQGATTLARRPISPSVPGLIIITPAPGAIVGDTLTIEWQATDPDADYLFHVVQYSHDSGETWTPLAVDLPGEAGVLQRLDADIPLMPGTDPNDPEGTGLVRILTTDGIQTTMAIAGPFRVNTRAPLVHITAPRDGAVFHHGDQVVFRGTAFDPEDGNLTAKTSFQWMRNGNPFAAGREVAVPGHAPGLYTYQLCATDSHGNTVCDAITIESVGGARFDDADRDGIANDVDNCARPNPTQGDTDNDGAGDGCDNCPITSNPTQADGDFDGLGDACDPCPGTAFNDDDGDGVCFDDDVCPDDPDPQQADTDGDGIGDACDSCPGVADASQLDCDDDGIGDACEIDSGQAQDCNGNGRPDECDIGLGGSSDLDGDAVPDECTDPCGGTDTDGDGIGELCDNCPLVSNRMQPDADGDAEGDACDLDDGRIHLRFVDTELLEWDAEQGFANWNAYRSDLDVLLATGVYTQAPGSNPLAERLCDLPFSPTEVTDSANPGPGEIAVYLATGKQQGLEGNLGPDSDGNLRPNDNPCP